MKKFVHPDVFTATSKKPVVLLAMTGEDFSAWMKKASADIKHRIDQSSFAAKPGQIIPLYDGKGNLNTLVIGINNPAQLFDLAGAYDYVARGLSDKTLKARTFKLEGIKRDTVNLACIGWGLAAYRFDLYKTDKALSILPKLVWPDKADRKSILAHIESACLIRTLINIPANDMGPDELEKAARKLAAAEGLTIKVIKDKDLLKQNFPMIYEVGKGSSRRPRLIDMHWGNTKHPKITLVGKGICFDTGGLDIKPSSGMFTMKKDMGGAAHVLGLAMLIIRHKLPVRLRVLIPVAENSISGDAYRPSDIINTRKGITVEVGNTDAEGRLVLGDTLTLACEENPDLLIDFATLTGAARVALGMEIPALLSNNEKLAFTLKDIAGQQGEALWPLPLWDGYRREISSDCADISSTGGKAGAVTAALFLETFVDPKIDWVHIDLSAWNEGSRPGRPKGGMEMGSRTVFAYLQERFGKR
jgi:leucyl aminopeptidase